MRYFTRGVVFAVYEELGFTDYVGQNALFYMTGKMGYFIRGAVFAVYGGLGYTDYEG